MIEILPELPVRLNMPPCRGQSSQMALTNETLALVRQAGPGWTIHHNARIVGICGHSPAWAGRTIMWAYFSPDAGPSMLALTRATREFLDKVLHLDFPRVEAYAMCSDPLAAKWMKLLGFKSEGVMRKFAHGADYELFARVR